jgi:hypothetical protein
MNIIAPRPQKPSFNYNYWNEQDEACQELRQILLAAAASSHQQQMEVADLSTIIRTNNPLPLDSSFIPSSSASVTVDQQFHEVKRPRSFSVGDSRNFSVISLVH